MRFFSGFSAALLLHVTAGSAFAWSVDPTTHVTVVPLSDFARASSAPLKPTLGNGAIVAKSETAKVYTLFTVDDILPLAKKAHRYRVVDARGDVVSLPGLSYPLGGKFGVHTRATTPEPYTLKPGDREDVLVKRQLGAHAPESRWIPVAEYVKNLNNVEAYLQYFGHSLREPTYDFGVIATFAPKTASGGPGFTPFMPSLTPQINVAQPNTAINTDPLRPVKETEFGSVILPSGIMTQATLVATRQQLQQAGYAHANYMALAARALNPAALGAPAAQAHVLDANFCPAPAASPPKKADPTPPKLPAWLTPAWVTGVWQNDSYRWPTDFLTDTTQGPMWEVQGNAGYSPNEDAYVRCDSDTGSCAEVYMWYLADANNVWHTEYGGVDIFNQNGRWALDKTTLHPTQTHYASLRPAEQWYLKQAGTKAAGAQDTTPPAPAPKQRPSQLCQGTVSDNNPLSLTYGGTIPGDLFGGYLSLAFGAIAQSCQQEATFHYANDASADVSVILFGQTISLMHATSPVQCSTAQCDGTPQPALSVLGHDVGASGIDDSLPGQSAIIPVGIPLTITTKLHYAFGVDGHGTAVANVPRSCQASGQGTVAAGLGAHALAEASGDVGLDLWIISAGVNLAIRFIENQVTATSQTIIDNQANLITYPRRVDLDMTMLHSIVSAFAEIDVFGLYDHRWSVELANFPGIPINDHLTLLSPHQAWAQ